MKPRFIRSLLASILITGVAPVVALGSAWLTLASPVAAAPAERVECRVHAVLLSEAGNGKLPKNLEFLREHLEPADLAFYKGFHLLDTKVYKLTRDVGAENEFKTGHKLGLTLLGGEKGKLKLHSKLRGRDGKTALIDTSFSIADNGLIIFSPGNYKSAEVAGKLLFPVHCKSRS